MKDLWIRARALYVFKPPVCYAALEGTESTERLRRVQSSQFVLQCYKLCALFDQNFRRPSTQPNSLESSCDGQGNGDRPG